MRSKSILSLLALSAACSAFAAGPSRILAFRELGELETKQILDKKGFYLSVQLDQGQWHVKGISKAFPDRKTLQEEVFLVAPSQGVWFLPWTKHTDFCTDEESAQPLPYSICSSSFAKFSVTRAVIGLFKNGTSRTRDTDAAMTAARSIDQAEIDAALEALSLESNVAAIPAAAPPAASN